MSCFGLSLHCSKTRWISSTCPTYSSFDQRWPFPILKQLRTHLPVDFKTIPSILQSRLRSEVLLFFLTKGNVLLPIFWIGFHYSNLLLFQRVNPSTSPKKLQVPSLDKDGQHKTLSQFQTWFNHLYHMNLIRYLRLTIRIELEFLPITILV